MKKPRSQSGVVSVYLLISPVLSIGFAFLLDGILKDWPTAARISGFVVTGIIGPIVGLIFGIIGLRDKKTSPVFPVIGTIFNSCWLLLAAGLIGLQIWFSTGHW